MKVSTKGQYGLEALVDLALHSSEGQQRLSSISARCSLSESYLLQIFLNLRRAGIVASRRGSRGGYYLARDPQDITVGEILNALEGPLAPVSCVLANHEDFCERSEDCLTRGLWERIMFSLNDVARSISLQDLVECVRAAESSV